MYQIKREDGTTYITSENPYRTRFETILDWFRDKWNWLLTFNNPPKITINQDLVAHEGGSPAVVCNGRLILTINGDITLKPSKCP